MLNKIKFTACALALVSLAACGRAGVGKKLKAKEPDHGKFTLPGSGDGSAPLDLTGTDLNVDYNGNVLLWDEHATPDQIAAISDASVNGRLAKAEWKRYKEESVAPLDAAIVAKKADIKAANDEADRVAGEKEDSVEARQFKISHVAHWFEDHLAALQTAGALDAQQLADTREGFAAYCEFKLYEFGLSQLVQLKFTTRPTPLSMCEAYYAAQGFFPTNAAACAPSAAGADYFDCIWGEGILKSQTFKAIRDSGAECAPGGKKRADAITEWFNSGLLRRIAFDNGAVSATDKTAANLYLRKAFLETGAQATLAPIKLSTKYADIGACKKFGNRQDIAPPVESGAPGWQKALFNDLKNIVEVPDSVAAKYKLFAARDGEPADAAAARGAVAAKLRLYAERNQPLTIDAHGDPVDPSLTLPDGTVAKQVPASIDDQLINKPEGQIVPTNWQNYDAVKDDDEFKVLLNVHNELRPKDLLDKAAALSAELDGLQQERDAAEAQLDQLDQKVQQQNGKGLTSVTAPGAVVFSRNMAISIRTLASFVEATVSFGGSPVKSRGCVWRTADAAPVFCGDSEVEGFTPFQRLSYDRETGKLLLVVNIGSAEEMGLGPKERNDKNGANFSDLAPDALDGRQLELEVYPNKLNPYYQFVTGNARLIGQNGVVEREGSFSADNQY